MEVEARMNRNYFPPSIHGAHYSGHAAPAPAPAPAPAQQGSITAGTPTFPRPADAQPGAPGTPMDSSESVPRAALAPGAPAAEAGSGAGDQFFPGSIVSGTPARGQGRPGPRRVSHGPQRSKQTLATVQELAREHAERYSPVRRASESSPPPPAHHLLTARLEYQQLQRGLERRAATTPAPSPPLDPRLHTPAASMPGSPLQSTFQLSGSQPLAVDLGNLDAETNRCVLGMLELLLRDSKLSLEEAQRVTHTRTLPQDVALLMGLDLRALRALGADVSREISRALHYALSPGPASPLRAPRSPLHQITEGLSYLRTGPAGSITRGTPQPCGPLDLRAPPDPPPSLPCTPEMTRNLQDHFRAQLPYAFPPVQTHPQISLTDCLGSEVTLVASSSEDSMDSLENRRDYPLPHFVISEPSDLDDRPSITRGIGRKVSQEVEPAPEPEEAEEPPPPRSEETPGYRRRGSDRSLGFSDDSLSNDSAAASPHCERSVHAIYSNLVSASSGFSETRGSFSDHRESFSFSDRGSLSERGSISERGETPRSSLSAQGALGELHERREDALEDAPPILLSPQKVNCHLAQELYEVSLSTSCARMDSRRIVELLQEAISSRVPPRSMQVERAADEGLLSLEYSGGVQIELAVCPAGPQDKRGLKMRRISGDQQEYGKLCRQLISSLAV